MSAAAEQIEDVYRRRYSGFRHGAAALAGSYELAHDAVQDGFAAALEKRRQFRGGSLVAWVWRIVARKALDLARRRGAGASVDERLPPSSIVSERDPDIAAAVRALSPRRRLVVFLRYFADLSYAEIAEVCGVSEGTVAATLARAHADLRAALQREEVER